MEGYVSSEDGVAGSLGLIGTTTMNGDGQLSQSTSQDPPAQASVAALTLHCQSANSVGEPQPGSRGAQLPQKGIFSIVCSLVASCIGTGLLVIPYCFNQCGPLLGLALIVFSAAVSSTAMWILMASMHYFDERTYHEVARKACGPFAGWLVNNILLFNGVTVTSALLVFLRDFYTTVFLALFGKNATWVLSPLFGPLVLAAVLTTIFPLAIRKNFSALRSFTMLYTSGLLLTTSAVAIKILIAIVFGGEDGDKLELRRFTNPPSHFAYLSNGFSQRRTELMAFCVFIFGFMQHHNVIPIARDLITPQNSTPYKLVAVALGATAVEALVYIAISVLFCVGFGFRTRENFFDNFAVDDPTITICRIILALCMSLAIPVTMIVTHDSFMEFLASISAALARLPFRKSSYPNVRVSSTSVSGSSPTPESLPVEFAVTLDSELPRSQHTVKDKLLNSVARPHVALNPLASGVGLHEATTPLLNVSASGPLDRPVQPSPQITLNDAITMPLRQNVTTAQFGRHYSVGLLLALEYLLAQFTTNVAKIAGVIGGCLAAALMCLLPAFIYYQGIGKTHFAPLRYIVSVALIGCFMVAATTSVSLLL